MGISFPPPSSLAFVGVPTADTTCPSKFRLVAVTGDGFCGKLVLSGTEDIFSAKFIGAVTFGLYGAAGSAC